MRYFEQDAIPRSELVIGKPLTRREARKLKKQWLAAHGTTKGRR